MNVPAIPVQTRNVGTDLQTGEVLTRFVVAMSCCARVGTGGCRDLPRSLGCRGSVEINLARQRPRPDPASGLIRQRIRRCRHKRTSLLRQKGGVDVANRTGDGRRSCTCGKCQKPKVNNGTGLGERAIGRRGTCLRKSARGCCRSCQKGDAGQSPVLGPNAHAKAPTPQALKKPPVLTCKLTGQIPKAERGAYTMPAGRIAEECVFEATILLR